MSRHTVIEVMHLLQDDVLNPAEADALEKHVLGLNVDFFGEEPPGLMELFREMRRQTPAEATEQVAAEASAVSSLQPQPHRLNRRQRRKRSAANRLIGKGNGAFDLLD